jgi:hypothetical protein
MNVVYTPVEKFAVAVREIRLAATAARSRQARCDAHPQLLSS